MLRSLTLLLLGLGLIAAAAGPAVTAADQTPPAAHGAEHASPTEASAFRLTMRELWEDHATWTRLFIVSAAADLPDQDATAARLLRNQSDIGDALAPFYGEAAGDELTALLRDHILGAAVLLAAVRTGDQARTAAATAAWYANADEIAAFLGAANPGHWSRAAMRAEMAMHLDLTLKEAGARLRGDWAADIAAYDEVRHHILGWADLLSAGVIRQFPDRFA